MSNKSLSLVLDNPENNQELELIENNESYMFSSIIEKYKKLKVGDLLIFSGDQHFYQYFALIVLFIMGILEATFKYSIPYLFFNVQFECKDENGIFNDCPAKMACSANQEFKIKSEIFSLNANFGLYCENLHYSMYSAIFIVAGGGLLSFFIFLISEYFGRINCYYAILIFHFISIVIVYIAKDNLILSVLFLMFNYATVFAWYSNVTIFLNESLGGVIRLISMPMIMIARSVGIMFGAVSFYFMPDYLLNHAVLVTILLSIGPCYFLMYETLFFQYQKYTLGSVYSTAKKICNMNFSGSDKIKRKNYIYKMLFVNSHLNTSVLKITEETGQLPIQESNLSDSKFIYLEEQLVSSMSSISVNYSQSNLNKSELILSGIDKNQIIDTSDQKDPKLSEEIIEKIKNISYSDLIKNDKKENEEINKNQLLDIFKINHFMKLVGATIIICCILCANGLTMFSIQSIGLSSIYEAGILIGITDLIGGICGVFSASFLSNKTSIIFSQFMFLLGSSILLINHFYQDDIIENYFSADKIILINIIISLILRLFVSYSQGIAFTYFTEIFPTTIRTLAFGIIVSFGRIAMGYSEYFIYYLNKINLNPNAAIFLFAIFSFPISFCMPKPALKMGN